MTAPTRTTRTLLAGAGTMAALYGGYLLLDSGWGNLAQAVLWLVGGVLAHDGLLAPVTLGALAVGVAVLPAGLRGPSAAGLVVLGTVTLSAVPVLGRFGARPDDPTLLDRDYIAGWLVFAGLVCGGVAVTAWLTRRGRDGQ